MASTLNYQPGDHRRTERRSARRRWGSRTFAWATVAVLVAMVVWAVVRLVTPARAVHVDTIIVNGTNQRMTGVSLYVDGGLAFSVNDILPGGSQPFGTDYHVGHLFDRVSYYSNGQHWQAQLDPDIVDGDGTLTLNLSPAAVSTTWGTRTTVTFPKTP